MMEQDNLTKKRPQRRLKKKRTQRQKFRRLLLILAGFIFICLLAALGWKYYQDARQSQFQGQIDAVQNGSSESFVQNSPDTPLYVLLVGVDNDMPQHANFIGIAAINRVKKQVDFIMLPDNTRIIGRKEKGIQELQNVYSEGGLPLLRAVVEDIFHIPIPFYAEFTENAFEKMIDMGGGMPMYVEKNMYHADATGETDINLFQGYQTLDGQEAAGYMRYIDSDGYLSRTQRQERFVREFYEEREHHFGIANALFMYRFWNQVQSNISAKDMALLAFDFKNVPVSAIHFYILPGEMVQDKETSYQKLWTYDPVEAQKIIGTMNNAIAAAPTVDMQQTNIKE